MEYKWNIILMDIIYFSRNTNGRILDLHFFILFTRYFELTASFNIITFLMKYQCTMSVQ